MFIAKGAALCLACAIAPITSSLLYGAGGKVERGKYLVEEVAKCGDCHTPLQNGQPDQTKWLKGAALPFAPVEPIPHWSKMAPDLTPEGHIFQRWGAQGLVTFLTTGKGPRGNIADPPMPTYKMKNEDAEAIVEYLKTLK
jgi:mono/diheme cytochrome c family protein